MADVPAIEVRELTRRFGRFTAVDAVTFEIRRGEIFGFLGANGAGKTTAIRMLTGLLQPTSGDARVDGLDVYTQSDATQRRIAYMRQRFSLHADPTTRENIAFSAGTSRLGRSDKAIRSRNVIETLELTEVSVRRI